MRHSSVIWLVLVVAVICPAVLAEEKPSPALKRILDKAVGSVRANRTEFDKASEKPLSEARQELQDLSTKLIKDGKTDEATAVLAHVKTLETDVMKMANAPAPSAGRPVPTKPLLERMAGKWDTKASTIHMRVYANGSVEAVRNTDGGLHERASAKLISPEVVEVRWDSGFINHWRLAGEDTIAVYEWDAKGKRTKGFSMERLQ